MKKILITGSAGFIAPHIAEEALNLGWEVIGVDTQEVENQVKDKKIKYIKSDLRDLTLGEIKDVNYVAWLKITKSNINAYNFPQSLVIWNKTKNSLSSNFYQKLSDGFAVFMEYEKFNFIKSLYYLLLLGINSIKRKI